MPSKTTTPKTPAKPKPPAKPRKPAASKPPKPRGRPSDYSEELADEICAMLSEGLSLRTICRADDMPDKATVFRWLRLHATFRDQYTRAKQESADALVEEMLDIADDGTNDWMEVHDQNGACVGYKVNGDHVQRSRLRLETRKWIASKLKPKQYGDKVDLNHGVQPDNPLASILADLSGVTLKPVTDGQGE